MDRKLTHRNADAGENHTSIHTWGRCVSGAEWAQHYNEFPVHRALREARTNRKCTDTPENEQWIKDSDDSAVVVWALSHYDVDAYDFVINAVKAHLPKPLADGIVAIGKYAFNHASDEYAWLTFTNAMRAPIHYREYAHALAAFIVQGESVNA